MPYHRERDEFEYERREPSPDLQLLLHVQRNIGVLRPLFQPGFRYIFEVNGKGDLTLKREEASGEGETFRVEEGGEEIRRLRTQNERLRHRVRVLEDDIELMREERP